MPGRTDGRTETFLRPLLLLSIAHPIFPPLDGGLDQCLYEVTVRLIHRKWK